MTRCPSRNAASPPAHPITSATPVTATAFAASNRPRTGTAVRLGRMLPLANSRGPTSTPSAPPAPRPPRQTGPGAAARELAGHHEHAEHADRDLREQHAG